MIARTLPAIGIEHIVTGFDHLLFVLGLLILVARAAPSQPSPRSPWPTASRSPARLSDGCIPGPRSAAIALSIAFVAGEIIRSRQGHPGLRRVPVDCRPFGLTASVRGALTEVGLPQSAVPMALLFFNVGSRWDGWPSSRASSS
jgi:hypothetical protein